MGGLIVRPGVQAIEKGDLNEASIVNPRVEKTGIMLVEAGIRIITRHTEKVEITNSRPRPGNGSSYIAELA